VRSIRVGLRLGLLLLLGAKVVAQSSPVTSGGATPGPWKQLAKLTEANGQESDWLGWSVAISKDGSTAAVGAVGWCRGHGSNGCGQGAVFVFVKPASGWADATETAMLTASDTQPGDYLGESVAISDDGSAIVAGAPEWPANGKSNGALYMFVKPQNGWKNATQTARLTSTDGGGVDLGDSVAIDRNTVAGGGKYFNGLQGAAYVFVKPQSGWKDMTQKARLTPSDGQGGFMGWSISMNENTIVAGAPITGTNGAGDGAYVFVKPKNGWRNGTETGKLAASTGTGWRLGYSVSIAADTVAVGAPRWGSSDKGAAYVYLKPSKGWRNLTETARLGGRQKLEQLGLSVWITDDGRHLAAGAPGLGLGGATLLFDRPQDGWTTTSTFSAKLVAADHASGDSLGWGVSLIPGTTIAGAPNAKVGSNPEQGAAYIFGR
jgi:FG-GAP repeat